MLEVPLLFWRYARVLADRVSPGEFDDLKRRFQYVFLVAYEPPAPDGFRVTERQVSLIDLGAGPDAVWRGFRHNTRNEIKRAENDARLSFVNLDARADSVYAFYARFERARGWIPWRKAELERCLLFTASFDEKLIAGIACYAHGDTIRVGKIFSVRNYESGSGVTPALIGWASRKIVWEICKYAHAQGMRRFDLGGVNFADPVKAGISQFKQSFGGTITPVLTCRYERFPFPMIKKILAVLGRDIT